MKNIQYLLILVAGLCGVSTVHAGNPDRKGEAGAYELNAVPLRIQNGDAGPCRAIIKRI